jgi:hypothetical protein
MDLYSPNQNSPTSSLLPMHHLPYGFLHPKKDYAANTYFGYLILLADYSFTKDANISK